MTQEKNLRISKFPFQALSCKGSRWPWKTKGRRKRSRSPRRDQCMSCWDLGGIGTHAGAICPDPAKIPAEYAVVRLLTSSADASQKRRRCWSADERGEYGTESLRDLDRSPPRGCRYHQDPSRTCTGRAVASGISFACPSSAMAIVQKLLPIRRTNSVRRSSIMNPASWSLLPITPCFPRGELH